MATSQFFGRLHTQIIFLHTATSRFLPKHSSPCLPVLLSCNKIRQIVKGKKQTVMLKSRSRRSENSEVSQVFSENISSRSTTLTESSTQSEIRQHFGNEDFSGELPKKLIQLKKLKNGGTTIKKAKEDLEYCYDSLRLYENPYVTSSVDKKCGYSIELYLDNKYKTLMFSDLQLNADYPLYYDSSLDNISTNQLSLSRTPLQIKGKIRINIDREDQALLITSLS